MQLGLFVVVVFLSSMDLTGSSKVVKGKRQRRSMYEMLFFSTSSCDAVWFVQMVNVFTRTESWAEPGVPHEPSELPRSLSRAEMCTALSHWTCHCPKVQAAAPANPQAAAGREEGRAALQPAARGRDWPALAGSLWVPHHRHAPSHQKRAAEGRGGSV